MIKKKLIFIGLFAALLFTACKKEKYYEGYHTYCFVLKNNSGHDLKINMVREDTTVFYHFADNDSAVFADGKNLLFDGIPSISHGFSRSTWQPNSIVERIATLTFDDVYSHVSKHTYCYDSIGKFEQIICSPEDWNFFHIFNSLPFAEHNYIQNDTFFHQVIVTPAYYDQAVEQSAVSQK